MNKSARFGVGYADIADKLSAEIRAGKYAVRHSFPSLTKIMRRFGVTRVTALRTRRTTVSLILCQRGLTLNF